jgi:hypothetical protein
MVICRTAANLKIKLKIELNFCGSGSLRACGKRRPWASPPDTWLVGPGVAASCRRIFCGAPGVPSVELAAPWRVARRQAIEQGGACAAAAAG